MQSLGTVVATSHVSAIESSIFIRDSEDDPLLKFDVVLKINGSFLGFDK